jgi:hypothetical protein
MNFGPFPVLLPRILELRWTCWRWGPVHFGTLPRPSSSPSSSPFQSHVACSFHLPIRLRTLWLPYALGDLAGPPPRTATVPQLWHQRAPQRAPRPCPCVPTLKHGHPLGKSAVPIPPRVRGSGPCVARGASGSHTHIELRPGGWREERGMRVRMRVRLHCRAAAGGKSESARGSGNASANAHGLAVRAGMTPCRGTRAHGRSTVLHVHMRMGVLRVLVIHRRGHRRAQHG